MVKASLNRWLLQRLLSKSPPETVSIDDPSNDYVSVESAAPRATRFVVRKILGDDVLCWGLDNAGKSVDMKKPISEILMAPLAIKVFKRGLVIRCETLWEAYRHSYLGATESWLRRRNRYDSAITGYRGRIDVLGAAVRLRERSARERASFEHELGVGDLAAELYGEMLHHSERATDVVDNVRMKLASFLETGEISTRDRTVTSRFFVQPKAYATLAAYGADERRHEDSIRAQDRLAVLTRVLALVAVLQLLAYLFDEQPAEPAQTDVEAPR